MLTALLAIGGIGLIAGFGLAIASKIFYVYVDPKIVAVDEALPGANCGGCGFPGCSGAAVAIVRGDAPTNVCVGGGPEVHARVAGLLGVAVQEREPEIASPGCFYGVQDADLKYAYDGFRDCRAAMLLDGGSKVCPIGCLGLGTCAAACPFGALSMGADNLPVVNAALCTGCGTCERICPKGIITLTSNSKRIQNEYTLEQCSAPCQRSCPAGIDIPGYIRFISEGDYTEAVRTIKETNPFPSVCGRICVHPCESECRRNLVDEPVAINPLKRFVADVERERDSYIQVPRAPASGQRVAVVGGGAEGLTAAYHLNRLGHEATVFEAAPKLGGLLLSGIPENRLPREILEWEIDGILAAGVEAKTGQKLGEDFTIASLLQQGYGAVFIATGGWDTRLHDPQREQKSPSLPGLGFLVDFILGRSGDTPEGDHVMILGGGQAALRAATRCIQEGARSVYVVSRESRDRLPVSEDELRDAEEMGVAFFSRSGLTRMSGQGNRLTEVEISRISEEGHPESTKRLAVNRLFIGAGRFPELIYGIPLADQPHLQAAPGEAETRWETLSIYPSPFALHDIGIFRPGEATGDYKAVVEAIGSGRRAANSIHLYLTGEPVAPPAGMIRKYTPVLGVDQVESVGAIPRQRMHRLPAEEQISHPDAEIDLGLTEDQALLEANRCLQCGLICYRRTENAPDS